MRIIILFITFLFMQYAAAQTPAELKNKLPQVPGWEIDPTIETFDANNLFERINGAAEGYLLYDFEELTVFVYNQKTGGNDAPYITIQVYRHADPDNAFGIYAAERPSESNFMPIGAEGYREGSMLNFFVDCLYVKIESPSSSDDAVHTIEKIARDFGKNINAQAAFPTKLQSFPAENKLPHTEQYIPKEFLGHEFLKKAFTVDYQLSGKKYMLFVIDAGTADDAKALLTKYYQFTKQTSKLREGRLTIKDRYNGNLECQWKGRYVWGLINDGKAPVKVDDVLKEIGKKLP